MPKVKAEAKWVEHVHSVVGNTTAYSAVYEFLSLQERGSIALALRRVPRGVRGKSKSLYMK